MGFMVNDSQVQQENYLSHQKGFGDRTRQQFNNYSPNQPRSAVSKHNPGSPPTGQDERSPENPLQEVVNFMSRQTANGRYNSISTQGQNTKEEARTKKNMYTEVDSFEQSLVSNLAA